MSKRMILKLGGTLEQGFRVTVQIWEQGRLYPNEKDGALAAAPALAECLNRWLHSYRQQAGLTRLTVHKVVVQAANPLEVFRQQAEALEKQFQDWLKSSSFYEIELWLREKLNPKEPIQVLLRSEDRRLHHLPWHEWDFLNRYLQTDLAIVTALEPVDRSQVTPRPKARMLAILGDRTGIDTNADQQLLHALPAEDVELEFLLEPSRQQINDQLWDQDWDVLFFAGHSSTEKNQGRIYINAEDSLTIKELKYGLERAIARGLQLAIFNSCDGLGLAYELEQLHLPQLIVMREPVPDCVAQEFLKSFITAYANGESLYAAERIARQRLQPFEQRFPCATWLPIICQNLTEVPPTWQELVRKVEPERTSYSAEQLAELRSLEGAPIANNGLLKTSQALEAVITNSTKIGNELKPSRTRHWHRLRTVLLTSFVVTGLVMGVRSLGWLQSWELPAYDQMLRLRPDEGQDKRLLLITIDDADIAYQQQQKWQRRWSLSDEALDVLLQKLDRYEPRAIGLDVVRSDSVDANQADLAKRLKEDDRFYAVCDVKVPGDTKPGILPPPEVPVARQGFVNIPLDRDRVVRRHLLFMDVFPTSPCTTPAALSTALAVHYLQQQGIEMESQGKDMKLGKVIFKGLKVPDAGYQYPFGGSQVLLNYRSHNGALNIADTVSLTDVLTDKIDPETVKHRVILIGVTTSTTGDGDSFSTPYSTRSPIHQQVPGVMLHVQMVSQILSAVLDRRPLLQIPPLWVETVWILGWSLIGSVLVLSLQSRVRLAIAGAIVLVLLSGLCYGLLIKGYWVSFIPAALAVFATGGSVFIAVRMTNPKPKPESNH